MTKVMDRDAKGRQKAHEPTDQNRRSVKTMAAMGLNGEQVAAILGIAERTVWKHYGNEMRIGAPEAHAMVGQSLFLQAVGGPERDWEKARVAATIFYCKSRMGWRETTDVNLRGVVASYDLSKLSDSELRNLEQILGEITVVGGGEGGDSAPGG